MIACILAIMAVVSIALPDSTETTTYAIEDTTSVAIIVLKETFSTKAWPVNKESIKEFPNNGEGDYVVLNTSYLIAGCSGTYTEHIAICGYDEFGVFSYQYGGVLILTPLSYSLANNSGVEIHTYDKAETIEKRFELREQNKECYFYESFPDIFRKPFLEACYRGEPVEYYYDRFLQTGRYGRVFKALHLTKKN